MSNDRIYHLFAGALIASAVGVPRYLESLNLFAGLWAAVWSAAIGGGIKEWCDYKGECHTLDWRDFGCTMLGAVFVALFIVLLHFGEG